MTVDPVRVLILGAAGMLGSKLSSRLLEAGVVAGRPIQHLCLADVIESPAPATTSVEIERTVIDLAQPTSAERLVASRPDLIFHLAAVVSGEAEDDFEKGYRVNLDGTRALLEAIRGQAGYRPRLVFASSIASFGPPLPAVIGDEQATTPATSYGTQKAIGELLLADYSRRGFLEGVGIRLPTICVRPGRANLAVSGFFSNIIREPLNGQDAVLPVPETVRHWFASPRAAVDFLVHGAELDAAALGGRPCLTMPGVSATVADQLDALRRVAGDGVLAHVRREPDERVTRIVESWPKAFDARRARSLGFRAEAGFDEIIRVHIEDELLRTHFSG
jgi:nucleoside-diphosphate-sugar epimerase